MRTLKVKATMRNFSIGLNSSGGNPWHAKIRSLSNAPNCANTNESKEFSGRDLNGSILPPTVNYFNKGRCCRGEECSWAHDNSKKSVAGRIGHPSANLKQNKLFLTKNPSLCQAFMNTGDCSKGKNCREVHLEVCHFFLKGKCKNGHKCHFQHHQRSPSRRSKAQGHQDAKSGAVAADAVSPLNQ